MEIDKFQKSVYKNAIKNGLWEGKDAIPDGLNFILDEVSELFLAYGKRDFNNFKEELADVGIMLFSFAEKCGINLEFEMVNKHEINKKRPYKHRKG